MQLVSAMTDVTARVVEIAADGAEESWAVVEVVSRNKNDVKAGNAQNLHHILSGGEDDEETVR